LKQGNLIISNPFLFNDSYFNRSVILLANHKTSNSIGFILNKPFNISLNSIIPEIKQKFDVFAGGPVETDNLFFIHDSPNLIPNSKKIENNLYWGGDFDSTIKLLNSKSILNNNIKFFLGYSGWTKNQLKNEYNANSWIIKQNTYKEKIIIEDYKNMWKNQIKLSGSKYDIWLNSPENPNFN